MSVLTGTIFSILLVALGTICWLSIELARAPLIDDEYDHIDPDLRHALEEENKRCQGK